MNYFSTSDQAALNLKKKERKADLSRTDEIHEAYQEGCATKQQIIDLYYLCLASRLLRAKFYAVPAYTNEELSYMVGCSSGTYLGLIMTRQKTCSKDMAIMMSENLKKLEKQEGMQPIHMPEYPQ